jgi:hypothetical protein
VVDLIDLNMVTFLVSSSYITIGDIEDIGRLFGWMKLTSEGANPNPLFMPGVEKSSISSFQTIPNSGDCTTAPNLE